MNNVRICMLVALLLVASLTTSCAGATERPVDPPPLPDLVIRSFSVDDPTWYAGSVFSAPATVVVENVGGKPAGEFRVGIVALNREDNHVSFLFDYDPQQTAGLEPGEQITVTGEARLFWHGHIDFECRDNKYETNQCARRDENTVWLIAIADHCSEDDGLPEHCAVLEADEDNNQSEPAVQEIPEKYVSQP